MIIDTHMHIGYENLIAEEMVTFLKNKGIWESTREKLSPSGVVSALDEGGIDKGVIFPLTFTPPTGSWQQLNDMTAEYVQAYPDRLIGFSIIDPRRVDESLKELERCSGSYGFKGLKIHPSIQEFYPNDNSLYPLYEYCQAENIILLSHTGASTPTHPDKFSQPMLFDEIAVQFPELKLILAHAGRPFYQEAALILRKHPNVYVDLCANVGRKGDTALLEMVLVSLKIYADGLKRVLFSSDFPVFNPAHMVDLVKRTASNNIAERMGIPGISAEELEGILGGNATQLLNITKKGV